MCKKNYLRYGLDWVYKFFFAVQSVCIYASLLCIIFTVLMRELFTVSIVWGYEIACWFVIILVYIAIPANLHTKSDIKVDVVYNYSPKVVQRILSVLHFGIEIAVLIMMATGFKTWLTMVGHGHLAASGLTNTMYYGVIGVGIIFGLIEMFCEVIDLFVKKDPNAAPQVREKTVLEMLEEDRVARLKAEQEAQANAEADQQNSTDENKEGEK